MRLLFALLISAVGLLAQLPANLDCKCTAVANGEYLCKCVPSAGATAVATPSPATASAESSATTSASQPASTAATTAPKSATGTPTGATTSTGQTIYTGPRGGQYHYSSSGKKVYERRKK